MEIWGDRGLAACLAKSSLLRLASITALSWAGDTALQSAGVGQEVEKRTSGQLPQERVIQLINPLSKQERRAGT